MSTPTGQVKELQGEVVSDKMQGTVVVSVSRISTHPLYRKQYTITKKYKVNNPKDKAKEGDSVVISETRPQSKGKRWEVKEILS